MFYYKRLGYTFIAFRVGDSALEVRPVFSPLCH